MRTGAACSWRACAFVAPGAPGHARLATLRERLRCVGGASAERTLALALEHLEKRARPESAPPTDGDASEASRSTFLIRACDVLVDLAWEKLHTGDWKDVDEAWRDLYVMASMAVADARGGFAPARAAQTLASLDRASLLGGPTFRDELERAIANAQEAMESDADSKKRTHRKRGGTRCTQLGDDAEDDVVAALPPGSLGARGRRLKMFSFDANGVPSSCDDREEDTETNRARRATLLSLASAREPVATFETPPSLERFLTDAMAPGAPAVLKGLARAWPAFAKWRDPAYLRAVAGARTVPVETGEHYLHATHARELVTLDAFLDEYVFVEDADDEKKREETIEKKAAGDALRDSETSGFDRVCFAKKRRKKKMGYLAQHALLDQIPALRRDVIVPDYCSLTLERDDRGARRDGAGSVATRAWLGPRGTVSPTHRDPTHNLLVQAVGSKYVRLYAPSQEKNLYLFSDPKRSNASRADPRDALDETFAKTFPAFSSASFSDAVLEPGDALYVPPGWFHYVQSVTSSFSVSFWWT